MPLSDAAAALTTDSAITEYLQVILLALTQLQEVQQSSKPSTYLQTLFGAMPTFLAALGGIFGLMKWFQGRLDRLSDSMKGEFDDTKNNAKTRFDEMRDDTNKKFDELKGDLKEIRSDIKNINANMAHIDKELAVTKTIQAMQPDPDTPESQ